jgi:hypothetical protein
MVLGGKLLQDFKVGKKLKRGYPRLLTSIHIKKKLSKTFFRET